ncbi:MAG: hypothetical protein J6B39_05445 [Lachnospiraceae bacterium]|nr:hypothetical protein [Lachnospiraceae bacterium]
MDTIGDEQMDVKVIKEMLAALAGELKRTNEQLEMQERRLRELEAYLRI